MADSRRINANIREEDEKRPAEEQPPFGVYAVILSSEFWPPFKDEKLEVPEDIREALEVYCKKYEKLKVLSTSPCGGNPGAGGPCQPCCAAEAGCDPSLQSFPDTSRASVSGVGERVGPHSAPLVSQELVHVCLCASLYHASQRATLLTLSPPPFWASSSTAYSLPS